MTGPTSTAFCTVKSKYNKRLRVGFVLMQIRESKYNKGLRVGFVLMWIRE